MFSWRQFELGPRIGHVSSREERLALDRRNGKPVTLVVYLSDSAERVARLPAVLSDQPRYLAQPVAAWLEGSETVVVRELAFGPTLADLIARGPQAEALVVGLLEQVLSGLAALHEAGRTHQRLLPAAVRFDLLTGQLKITDLERAFFEPEPPAQEIPRYLHPALRRGATGPANDLYSVARIGEALLRGTAPVGEWGPGMQGAPVSPLWLLLRAWQDPSADADTTAVAALAALRPLMQPSTQPLSLPIGSFVRGHVGALRELRRWRAQPLPPLPPEPPPSGYRQVVSNHRAVRGWGVLALAGTVSLLWTAALARSSKPGGPRSAVALTAEACLPENKPQLLKEGAEAPAGLVSFQVRVPFGAAVAIDGCPVPSADLSAGPEAPLVRLALSRGVHDLRAAVGERVLSQRFEINGKELNFDLEADPLPRPAGSQAVELFARHLAQVDFGPPDAGPDAFDPLEAGSLEATSQRLLAGDAALTENSPEFRAALPDELALSLDSLRAVHRRFQGEAAVCGAVLSTEAQRELGTERAADRALQAAAEFLTVTRLRGASLSDPLRLERQGLSELGVSPSPRLLTAVSRLSLDGKIAPCLAKLGETAAELEGVSRLVMAQLPGLLPDQEHFPDPTE